MQRAATIVLATAACLTGTTAGQTADVARPTRRPAFTDITVQAGLDVDHVMPAGVLPRADPMTGGGAIGDFNNDGWQDIFFLGGGGERDMLFINNTDGTFSEQGVAWGVGATHIGSGACAADFNDDGYIDIYITSHGTPGTVGEPGKCILYQNNGPDAAGMFSFTDVAAQVGVNSIGPIADGFGSAWGDYDLDGDLDLAVAGWFSPPSGNRLFRNDGAAEGELTSFTDATAMIDADMTTVRGFSPSFVDTDADWYPELLWVADFGTSKYLVNNTDGTFSDHTASAGVGHDEFGMGNTQGDLDNDGLIDWYVSSIYDPTPPRLSEGNKLYMNLGSHIFTEVSAPTGTDDGGWGWGTVAVDIDHDGDLDLAETNGWASEPDFLAEASKLFLNDGAAFFTDVAAQTGFHHFLQGRALARLDFDNDGDQDILIIANAGRLTLLRNDIFDTKASGVNWLRVFIDTSARSDLAPHGIGARVRAITPDATQLRYIDIAGQYLCNSEHSAHFGLAFAQSVTLEVEWHDGTLVRLDDIPVNQTITVYAPIIP